MWDVVMVAVQSPALQWMVVLSAVSAFVYKALNSNNGPLMGDMYRDDLDT
jgi:hypothetical protein